MSTKCTFDCSKFFFHVKFDFMWPYRIYGCCQLPVTKKPTQNNSGQWNLAWVVVVHSLYIQPCMLHAYKPMCFDGYLTSECNPWPEISGSYPSESTAGPAACSDTIYIKCMHSWQITTVFWDTSNLCEHVVHMQREKFKNERVRKNKNVPQNKEWNKINRVVLLLFSHHRLQLLLTQVCCYWREMCCRQLLTPQITKF